MKRILLLVAIFLGASIFLIKNREGVSDKNTWTAEQAWANQWEHKQPVTKTDRPDLYAKYHWMIRTRAGSAGPTYPANYRFKALQKAEKSQFKSAQARTQMLEFVERGPGNVPGRTRGLAVFSSDPQNSWIAGGVGGGMWRTTDAGASWTNLTEDLPNLAISTIAISASNNNIIYAGTGESFAGLSGPRGDGIFKSTNGGTTWTQLPATVNNDDFENVNRLIVDPNNSNIVLACTSNDPNFNNFNSGIFKSINGGTTWTQVFSGTRWVQQLVASPDDFNILYATVTSAGVFKSTNKGDTWLPSSTGMIPDGRVEIAIAPTDPNRIYASVEGTISGTESDLYLSEDAGTTWSVMIELNDAANDDFLGGQGGYDNTIAVHPYNEDIVYVGGVNMWKFTLEDGSSTGDPTVLGVTVDDTDSFLDFVSFDSGSFFENKLAIGSLPTSEFVSVEWRFGPGLSQKAHRFQVPPGGGTNSDGGAGVPDEQYAYQDYVDVPFEVWDVDNDRQLMISFRDQQRDGAYNLNPRDDDGDPGLLTSREYFFVHGIEYDPAAPDPSIAIPAGHTISQMYFLWPILAEGATPWDPNNLPDSKLTINFGSVINRFRSTVNVSDAFNQLSGNNRFIQSFGSSNTAGLGLHPDHHNLIVQRDSDIGQTFRLLVSNDGGVYYSNISNDPGVNDGDWIFAGTGYNTSQFYGADKKAGAFEFIGGMQDNGTYRSPDGQNANAGTQYRRQIGGDGFKVAWHYTDPAKIIGGSQFNGFRRTVDGGANWSASTVGLTDIGEDDAPFISWLANSKRNPNILFAVGASGVWRSPDFGGIWESVPISTNWGFNSLSQVAISEANPTNVWAGSGMTATSRLHFSTDGGNSFTSVNNFPGEPLGSVTTIATHPVEENTAYAVFSFSDAPKILRTIDAGQTWEDISGFGTNAESDNGFPDVPVFSLLVLPNDPNTIWAGTEIGIVESTDNGATWAIIDEFINAPVWELKAVDDQVVIATHGRGIWSVTIDGLIWPNEIVTDLPEDPSIPVLSLVNQPNPVQEGTNFNYMLPRSSKVQFEIVGSDGRLLARYDLGIRNQGPGKFVWNRDQLHFSSGVYFVRMHTDLGTRTSKMILK